MTATFLGKLSFTQGTSAQTTAVQIDAKGQVVIGNVPDDGSDRFNAYGDGSGFALQAANGKYLGTAGAGYAASQGPTEQPNIFVLEDDATGAKRVIDKGPGGSGTGFYWTTSGTSLSRVAKTATPPATTLFARIIVTPSIADILANGLGVAKPDLRWVAIPGVDFVGAPAAPFDFTTACLDHADFSGCAFDGQTGFDGSSGLGLLMAGARLSGCSLGSCTFTGADFTGADLTQTTTEKSRFDQATMERADFTGSLNLAGTTFRGARLAGAKFTDSANIDTTDFTGADLTRVDFSGASVTGPIILNGANCSFMALSNPKDSINIIPGRIKLDAATNLTHAAIRYLDLSGYDLSAIIFAHADLTGTKLIGARLDSADLSYAILDCADLSGTVNLHGANLSNAILTSADLTNAQLGALDKLFSFAEGTADYTALLTALQSGEAATVKAIFAKNGQSLSGTVTVTVSRFDPTSWAVTSTNPDLTYTVEKSPIGGQVSLNAFLPTVPAVLSNAFMVGAVLTGANLIGVNASGASIYGSAVARTDLNKALMRGMRLANANLGAANLHGADLAGVSFDYAVLTNSDFSSAVLTVSGAGGRTSFSGANLAGAKFDATAVKSVDFTNAVVGVMTPADDSVLAGAWLFSLPESAAALVTGEFKAAAAELQPVKPYKQFTLPLTVLPELQGPGPVGSGLKAGFAAAGITLTKDALVTFTGQSAFWNVTDGATLWSVFEAIQTVKSPLGSSSAPALGVAKGPDYATFADFYLPLSVRSSLRNGLVTAPVAEAFATAGHALGKAATVTIRQTPSEWQIVDGPPQYQVYSLWQGFDDSGLQVVGRPAIANVIAAFASASYALAQNATVSILAAPGSTKAIGWLVDNGSEDPFNPVTNYVIFTVLPNAGGGLDVYGRNMRVLRRTASGTDEFHNLPVARTEIVQSQLQDYGNVCPNGEFASTNAANNLPFDQWLRARVPARPPLCVPDASGRYNCPV